MSLRGQGALAIWCDIPPEHEAAFNTWYTFEHVPERVAVPGFRRGRRYAAAGRGRAQKYFTLYEVDTVEVLASAPYLDRLEHPTDNTRRMVSLFERNVRAVFRLVASRGQGVGGWMTTAAGTPTSDPGSLLLEVVGRWGAVAAHFLESEEAIARAKDRTAEGRVAAGSDNRGIPGVLLVEAPSAAVAGRVSRALDSGGLPWRPTEDGPAVGRYRLVYLLDAEALASS